MVLVLRMRAMKKLVLKKHLHDRGNKNILPIKYTPDFLDAQDPLDLL